MHSDREERAGETLTFEYTVSSHPQPKVDRARQFMPFAALKGYYDLLRTREHVPEPRHELTEEEAQTLSEKMAQVHPRTMVTVTHYKDGGYTTTCGLVSSIDIVGRTLTVVKQVIAFDDIRDVASDELFVREPLLDE